MFHKITDMAVQAGLSEMDAYYCFAMSKMTIKDEQDGGLAKYKSLKFPEFLEYFARVAVEKNRL